MKRRWIVIIGGILICAALVLSTLGRFLMPPAVGGSPYSGMLWPGMMSGYGMMAGFGWLSVLVMALFWIGMTLLIVWGVSTLMSMRHPGGEPDAQELLKRRYARGEISREEFKQALEVLR